MDEMILISVIVPVYNAQNYLDDCIRSIINNYIDDKIEVLLIDDGSTDCSGKICDYYCDNYSYIHTWHQKNQGAAHARNFGVEHSTGRYIAFVDADDYIADDALKQTIQVIQEEYKEFYLLKAYKVFGDGRMERMNQWQKPQSFYSKKDWIAWFSKMPKYPGSPCDKIVARSLLTAHDIWFEEARTAEDLYWVLQCMVYADSYQVLDINYYYYRQNVEGSVTSQITEQRLLDLSHAVELGIKLAEAFPMYQAYIYAMMAYEAEVLIYLFGQRKEARSTEVKYAIREMEWLLNYRSTGRTKIIRLLLKVFGITGCANILQTVRKVLCRRN